MFDFSSKSKQNVHFLHIGKTGGSAIKFALNNSLVTDKYIIKLHGHKTSLRDIPDGDLVFFFLRNPISRFTSGFYSRKRKGKPRYNSEWSPIEKQIFEHFSTPNDIAIALANKNSDDHGLAKNAMKNINHFEPYNKWYINFDYFKYRYRDIIFIGFQESLDVDFMTLKNILGLPQSVNLPTDDISAHRNPKNIDKTIDERGAKALREWYSDDFKFVSICKEIMSIKKKKGRTKKNMLSRCTSFFLLYLRR